MNLLRRAAVCLFIVAALLGRVAIAQDLKIDRFPSTNPWTSLELNNKPGNFQFVIVTDRTGGHRPGIFEDAVGKINLLQPEFVMSVGDLIEGYTENEELLDEEWNEFESFTAKLKMPFFYVPGNHDISNSIQHQKWIERFGRDYYHFVYHDVLFLCLNSEDAKPNPGIGREQQQYIQKALEENPDVRWTLVFLHRPLWTTEDRLERENQPSIGWREVETMLREGGRQFTVFAGHNHDYMKFNRGDRNFIVLATTGGGSQLRGTPFGEFDHVVWATMTDEGPVLANLMLSGIWDENIRTDESARRVETLASAARISAMPLQMEGDAFTSGEVELRLTNDANIPLDVSARFRKSAKLKVDPFALEERIEPNSVKVVKLNLSARDQAVAPGETKPLLLDATLTYTPTDAPQLALPRVVPIAIDRASQVAHVAQAVKVDGQLDEWDALPNICHQPMQIGRDASSWEGPGDGSFEFATAYDNEFVYLALNVIDERVMPNEEPVHPWTQDSLEIRFDARPDPVRSRWDGAGEFDHFLFLVLCPGESPDQSFLYRADGGVLPKDLRAVCVKSKTGYTAEIAIPVSYLNERQQDGWDAFRLNIALNDRDGDDARAHLWWRPDWRTEESYPGSGTFIRAGDAESR